MFLVHLFVYFVHVNFCPFSLPIGVKDWLRLVIVALPGLFCECFLNLCLAFPTYTQGCFTFTYAYRDTNKALYL